MRKERFCDKCGDYFPPHVYKRHRQACEKHPGKDMLVELYVQGEESVRSLTHILLVSHTIILRWLKAAKIPLRETRPGGVSCKEEVPDALWEFSKLNKCVGLSCLTCTLLDRCRERIANKMPILSEAPLPRDLKKWAKRGWI